jgi:hypothetical protein
MPRKKKEASAKSAPNPTTRADKIVLHGGCIEFRSVSLSDGSRKGRHSVTHAQVIELVGEEKFNTVMDALAQVYNETYKGVDDE